MKNAQLNKSVARLFVRFSDPEEFAVEIIHGGNQASAFTRIALSAKKVLEAVIQNVFSSPPANEGNAFNTKQTARKKW